MLRGRLKLFILRMRDYGRQVCYREFKVDGRNYGASDGEFEGAGGEDEGG